MKPSLNVLLVLLTFLQLLSFHKYGFVQGDEQLETCSINKDDNCDEDDSDYSEVQKSVALANDALFEQVLDNILVERVVGTASHARVADYINTTLRNLGWTVKFDSFNAATPRGTKPFKNIIAQLNPNASKVVALACHYDSKYFEDFVFLAATDSAVPCAMMIHLAQILQPQLQSLTTSDVSLDMIFFDGEEALRDWTSTDSIYGSRHLAAKMMKENQLERLNLLVLLDLLGAEFPVFQSHFAKTDKEHRMFVQIENKLRASNAIRGRQFIFDGRPERYFRDVPFYNLGRNRITIEDDHVPFFNRGVRVLHIIPTPFPSVWHRKSDDRSALDMNTIHDLNVMLRSFILKYFRL